MKNIITNFKKTNAETSGLLWIAIPAVLFVAFEIIKLAVTL